MPRYALRILEHDTSVTTGEYSSPDGECLQVSDRFTHDGRLLRVTEIGASQDPYEQSLVCVVG